jgi:CBS domain containing-hemolysin-like protein
VHSERPKPRGLAALMAMIGLAPEPETDAQPDLAAAALREQAEVFQTMTVGDVMTPRADIEAVELSATFEAVVAAFA